MMLVTRKKYDADIAALAADVRAAEESFDRLTGELQDAQGRLRIYAATCKSQYDELVSLRARLAPFIAKRDRDPVTKRFLSTRSVGEMGEGGL